MAPYIGFNTYLLSSSTAQLKFTYVSTLVAKKQNEMYLSKNIKLQKVLRAIKNTFNMCHVLQNF